MKNCFILLHSLIKYIICSSYFFQFRTNSPEDIVVAVHLQLGPDPWQTNKTKILHFVTQPAVAPFQSLLAVGIDPTPAQGPPYTFDFSNFVFEHDGSCTCFI